MNPIALSVERDPVGVALGGGHPIVPHQGIGHHEDLTPIAGVGEALCIASHGGSEDHLPSY